MIFPYFMSASFEKVSAACGNAFWRHSPCAAPTVDYQVGTIHIGRGVRTEEGDSAAVFIGLGHAAQRNELGQLADEHIVLPGIDSARRQRIAAHALLAPVGGQVLGQADQTML